MRAVPSSRPTARHELGLAPGIGRCGQANLSTLAQSARPRSWSGHTSASKRRAEQPTSIRTDPVISRAGGEWRRQACRPPAPLCPCWCGRWETFLDTRKAAPAGCLRPPSAASRRGALPPGHGFNVAPTRPTRPCGSSRPRSSMWSPSYGVARAIGWFEGVSAAGPSRAGRRRRRTTVGSEDSSRRG